MAKTKVLITVKTYPTISTKYDELVCTAGFTEDGKWIRIYPIQFRKLGYENQYKKYDWIEIDLVKNEEDFRPESFRPHSLETEPQTVSTINTDNHWEERKKVVLNKVYNNMELLIEEAKNKEICTSLAVFKPHKVIDFIWEDVDRFWNKDKIDKMQQLSIFEKSEGSNNPIRKLPFKFSYIFEDITGKRRTLMIEDWEVGALFWKYPDEKVACEKVKQKYFDDFAKTKDLHFFLGTTKLHHYVSRNPFVIIGTFHPTIPKASKVEPQLSLF
jgi:hypothetical protein